MSGIIGIISKSIRIDLSSLEKALDLIQHRGPDGRIIKSGDWGILGANSLNVTRQNNPIIAYSKDARVMLAMDGSILNYSSLKNKLQSMGVFIKNNSPHEIALELYLHDGIELCKQIIGHASLSIIDARKQKIFLVRDRLGVRPLYYQYHKRTLYFASEIKAILAVNPVHPDVNKDAIT